MREIAIVVVVLLKLNFFFPQLIDTLPDMDLVINTRDWPQINNRFGTAKPVFSFSKVRIQSLLDRMKAALLLYFVHCL